MSKSRFICPTVQSRAYGLEWLGVICTTETYQGFLYFFLRKEALLTPLTSTHNFSQISFSLLHLTVVKILVQLTLLISKTGFRVWVLDWSVRHIFFFCTWIIGLFHYHFINNGSCHAIIGHLGLSKWVQSYVVTLFFKCKNISAKKNYSSYPHKACAPTMDSKRVTLWRKRKEWINSHLHSGVHTHPWSAKPVQSELPEPKPSDPERGVVGGRSQRLKTDADVRMADLLLQKPSHPIRPARSQIYLQSGENILLFA